MVKIPEIRSSFLAVVASGRLALDGKPRRWSWKFQRYKYSFKIRFLAMNGEVLFCVVGKIGYGKHLEIILEGYDSYKEPIEI